MPLTDTVIRKAKPKAKPFKLSDSGGLFLLVQPSGGKWWRYKYRFAGKEKLLALGSYPETTLAMARKRHLEARELVAAGEDPGEAFIAKLPEGEKRTRMAAVFRNYSEGNNIQAVMAAVNVSKGSVSGYLNEIEAAIGCRIVRGSSHANKGDSMKDGMKDAGLYQERKHGLRRASVLDFHSFRVTWVTLALTAGVPLELVQKVTGHKTTDIVLKHYFQPGREAFRSALNAAMPKLLMSGSEQVAAPLAIGPAKKAESGKPAKQDKAILAILERSTAKTWKQGGTGLWRAG